MPSENAPTTAGFQLQINPDALEPLVRRVAEEVALKLEESQAAVAGKLAYPEAEAARLVSLNPWQLRDERLRGRIRASKGPGGKVLYRREDLTAYLLSRPWSKS